MLISPALGKLKQEDYHEFHANLGYTTRVSHTNTKQTTTKKTRNAGGRELASMHKALGGRPSL